MSHRVIDVIVQEENDPNGYGWNNEAYLNNWKTPQYRLAEGDYKVKINIATQNGVSFSKILNLKIRKNLELTILEDAKCLAHFAPTSPEI